MGDPESNEEQKNCHFFGGFGPEDLDRLKRDFEMEPLRAASLREGIACAAQQGAPLILKGGDIVEIVQANLDAWREESSTVQTFLMLRTGYLYFQIGEVGFVHKPAVHLHAA